MELDINSMATVTLAVSGDVDQNLYTYVDDKIVPEFEKLSSVGEVSIAGGQESYTRVELIPEKLAQYHLNMNTVAQLVGAADFTIPAGDVRVGKQDLDVSVGNEFKSTESLKNVVLPLENGETIHLSDIANVYEALEDAISVTVIATGFPMEDVENTFTKPLKGVVSVNDISEEAVDAARTKKIKDGVKDYVQVILKESEVLLQPDLSPEKVEELATTPAYTRRHLKIDRL